MFSFLPPPLTITFLPWARIPYDTHRRDACRFSHDAQAVAAFGKREESGAPPPKAPPKPLPVPAARPAAGAGSPGAPRRTGTPSKPTPSPATATRVEALRAHRNDESTRATSLGLAAKSLAVNGRANPWASVATPSIRFEKPTEPNEPNGDASARAFPAARAARTAPFEGRAGDDFGPTRSFVAGSSDRNRTSEISRPNFSFGSGSSATPAETRAGAFESLPGGASDFGGGGGGGASSAPRDFGAGPTPAASGALGGGSPPAFAGGGLGGLFGGPSATSSAFGNAFGFSGSPGGGAAGASPVWGGGGFGGVGGVGGFGAFGGRAGGGSY